MKNILKFLKKDIVLTVATALALITCFIVPIDKEYLTYFDYNTLITLFCMLSVVSGLKSTNVFEYLSNKLVCLFNTRRNVIYALVFGTFFFDMIVANDMSLITFLPLTYIVLHSTGNDEYLAFTFIMQTIAANMGGMITPYGNPQNLYLYSYYNIEPGNFFSILIIYTVAVAILLFLCGFAIKNEPIHLKKNKVLNIDQKKLPVYVFLFIIVILSIFRIIPNYVMVTICVLGILFTDVKIFKQVDYSLLATFCVFFVFSGNMARITFIKDFISQIVVNHTLLAGIISCQFISNVPTAVFLSKFTNNYRDLLIAVNIGSLGILISSLASLITFKEFLKHQKENFKIYLVMFTIFNTLFLVMMLILSLFDKQ